jgi:hypothetical protein
MRVSRSPAGFVTALLAALGLPACDSVVDTPFEPQLNVWGRSPRRSGLLGLHTERLPRCRHGAAVRNRLTNIPLVVAAT